MTQTLKTSQQSAEKQEAYIAKPERAEAFRRAVQKVRFAVTEEPQIKAASYRKTRAGVLSVLLRRQREAAQARRGQREASFQCW